MKKLDILFCVIGFTFLFTSCSKKSDVVSSDATPVNESQVLTDFAYKLANPNYQDIQAKANLLNLTVITLNTSTNEANLAAARAAWFSTRQAWEQCEGFLFGPVEDYNYDPTMDDWPVNKVDLDSLLASSNPLTLSDIDALPTSLKGFHPIEYIIFGVGGTKTAEQLTVREKQYLISLTQSLYNTTTALRNSWDPELSNSFTNELVNAGKGSTRYASRKDAFIAIATSMAGICEEVADGKMQEPLAARDSTLEESQFSHNSTTDFKNNMIGVQNSYFCKYAEDGHGINEIVASLNISLDNKIQSQINTVINSFNEIDKNYGKAIYTQQVQIHNTQNAINTLRTMLETDLINFIQTSIKD
jgi:putative iron-regulated protein